jgi:hypothetical protein
MQNFIVLGIIPGTSIQLNFNFWLITGVLFTLTPFLLAAWRRRTHMQAYLVGYLLLRTIDRHQLPA